MGLWQRLKPQLGCPDHDCGTQASISESQSHGKKVASGCAGQALVENQGKAQGTPDCSVSLESAGIPPPAMNHSTLRSPPPSSGQ